MSCRHCKTNINEYQKHSQGSGRGNFHREINILAKNGHKTRGHGQNKADTRKLAQRKGTGKQEHGQRKIKLQIR